jgi:hypothetical protein
VRLYTHHQEDILRFTAYGVLSCCNCCDVGESGDKLCALHTTLHTPLHSTLHSAFPTVRVIKKSLENQNNQFNINKFFLENRDVYQMWKQYCRAVQVTDDNMAHLHCMLDN